MRFPKDASKHKVIRTLEALGFKTVRVGSHISMTRENPDGSETPLTMPNHERIKGSTLRSICRQSRIPREEFLRIYKSKP
jgi:predicted RNA binding protein YcfA (HicA-like mRNA interferase family)